MPSGAERTVPIECEVPVGRECSRWCSTALDRHRRSRCPRTAVSGPTRVVGLTVTRLSRETSHVPLSGSSERARRNERSHRIAVVREVGIHTDADEPAIVVRVHAIRDVEDRGGRGSPGREHLDAAVLFGDEDAAVRCLGCVRGLVEATRENRLAESRGVSCSGSRRSAGDRHCTRGQEPGDQESSRSVTLRRQSGEVTRREQVSSESATQRIVRMVAAPVRPRASRSHKRERRYGLGGKPARTRSSRSSQPANPPARRSGRWP